MKISSTEFQQRVGYYFSLVEKGVEVIIERRKPGEAMFVLSLKIPKESKVSADLAQRAKREEFLRELRSVRATFRKGEDCVDFQRRVRQ